MLLSVEIYVENATTSTAVGSVCEAIKVQKTMPGSIIRTCIQDNPDTNLPFLEGDSKVCHF